MFFCDDVRHELGNKITAIGLYGEFIGFPPGNGNVVLPKLAAVFILKGLRNVRQISIRQAISIAPATAAVPNLTGPAQEMQRDLPALDEHNIILQAIPIVFPGECTVVAKLEITADGETTQFENSIRVTRNATVPTPTSSTMPPGAQVN